MGLCSSCEIDTLSDHRDNCKIYENTHCNRETQYQNQDCCNNYPKNNYRGNYASWGYMIPQYPQYTYPQYQQPPYNPHSN